MDIVSESKYTYQTQVACPVLYPFSDLGEIATVVAIVLNLPARFGGSTSGLPVVQDFLYGMGTAMSPPLVWMVAQALLTWLAWNQRNRRSSWGVIGLALFGATTFIGCAW